MLFAAKKLYLTYGRLAVIHFHEVETFFQAELAYVTYGIAKSL